jgi:hypothetical protein
MADPPLGRKRLILQSRHHRESRPAALELLHQFHLPLHRDYHPPARVALQGHRLFIHTIYSTRAMTSVTPSPSKGAVRDAYSEPPCAPASKAGELEVLLPGAARTAVRNGPDVSLLAELLKAIERAC